MDHPVEVNCSVQNCKYNKRFSCHAEYLNVDAPSGQAHTCEGTACSTFTEE